MSHDRSRRIALTTWHTRRFGGLLKPPPKVFERVKEGCKTAFYGHMWARAEEEIRTLRRLYETYKEKSGAVSEIQRDIDRIESNEFLDRWDEGEMKTFRLDDDRTIYVLGVAQDGSQFYMAVGPTGQSKGQVSWDWTGLDMIEMGRQIKHEFKDRMESNADDLMDLSDIESGRRRMRVRKSIRRGSIEPALKPIRSFIDEAKSYADQPNLIEGSYQERIKLDLSGWKYVEDEGESNVGDRVIEESISHITEATQEILDIEWDDEGILFSIRIPDYLDDHGFVLREINGMSRKTNPAMPEEGNTITINNTYYRTQGQSSDVIQDAPDTHERFEHIDPDQPQPVLEYLFDQIDDAMDTLKQIKSGQIDVNPTYLFEGNHTLIARPYEKGQGYTGKYQADINAILITFKDSGSFDHKTVDRRLENMLQTARHEVLHLGQYALKEIFDLDVVGGLPPDPVLTDPDDIEHGGFKGQEHPKRDIEFYTRLNDEVGDFMDFMEGYDDGIWKPLMKAWMQVDVDPSKIENGSSQYDPESLIESAQFRGEDSFGTWKSDEPEKYRKAVKEFTKAVRERIEGEEASP